MGQTPRDEMVELQGQIDVINSRKSGWQKAYEVELKNNPDAQKPPELIAFNKQLGPLYSQKDALLAEHPELAKEFGGKKRKEKVAPTGFAPRTASMQLQNAFRAARNAKKNAVPSDFWQFCNESRPQIRQNMDSWEDAAIRSRYDAWVAEKAEVAKREAERVERERLATAEKAKETERILAERKRKELDEKCAEIPVAFSGDFLSYMGKSFKDQENLLKLWEDKEYQGLYQLWQEDQKKSSAA